MRGRVKDESKSRTFNKLWTAEEQRRLEELLVEHQPEPVEARRWAKIAESLGNRTTQQVGLYRPGGSTVLVFYSGFLGYNFNVYNDSVTCLFHMKEPDMLWTLLPQILIYLSKY